MMTETVTVIMPVYNGEKYIRKSIGSVFRQTYPNIELIVINDGSADGSEILINRLQLKAPKNVSMRCVTQQNQGICMTRNNALDMATGRYVAFIDQDDYMKPDFIQTMVTEIQKEDADVVIGGFDLVKSDGKILEKWELNPDDEWSKYRISAPWGRLFDKRVIDQHNIRFTVTKISEDLYFNFLFFSYAKKISVINYRGYCWLYNEKSESHAKMSKMADDRNPLIMMTELMQKMQKPNILKEEYFEYFIMKHIIWYLLFTAKSAEKKQLRIRYKECFQWLNTYFPDYKHNALLKNGGPKGETRKIRLIVGVAFFLEKTNLFLPFLNAYNTFL